MPTFDFYFSKQPATTYFSFDIGHEGIFVFIYPLQLAMLWPGVKL